MVIYVAEMKFSNQFLNTGTAPGMFNNKKDLQAESIGIIYIYFNIQTT